MENRCAAFHPTSKKIIQPWFVSHEPKNCLIRNIKEAEGFVRHEPRQGKLDDSSIPHFIAHI